MRNDRQNLKKYEIELHKMIKIQNIHDFDILYQYFFYK